MLGSNGHLHTVRHRDAFALLVRFLFCSLFFSHGCVLFVSACGRNTVVNVSIFRMCFFNLWVFSSKLKKSASPGDPNYKNQRQINNALRISMVSTVFFLLF